MFLFLHSFGGIINGVYLLITGILILYLCHQEVYVLTSLFILVFFELFFVMLNAIGFIFILVNTPFCDYGFTSICFHTTWHQYPAGTTFSDSHSLFPFPKKKFLFPFPFSHSLRKIFCFHSHVPIPIIPIKFSKALFIYDKVSLLYLSFS